MRPQSLHDHAALPPPSEDAVRPVTRQGICRRHCSTCLLAEAMKQQPRHHQGHAWSCKGCRRLACMLVIAAGSLQHSHRQQHCTFFLAFFDFAAATFLCRSSSFCCASASNVSRRSASACACFATGIQGLPQQGCKEWPEAAASWCIMEANGSSSRPCLFTGWLNIAASAGLCQVANSCCLRTQQQCEASIQKQQAVVCCRQTGYTWDERPEAAQWATEVQEQGIAAGAAVCCRPAHGMKFAGGKQHSFVISRAWQPDMPNGWPHSMASPFHSVALCNTCCAIARRMAGSRTGINSSLATSMAALHGRQAADEAVRFCQPHFLKCLGC